MTTWYGVVSKIGKDHMRLETVLIGGSVFPVGGEAGQLRQGGHS